MKAPPRVKASVDEPARPAPAAPEPSGAASTYTSRLFAAAKMYYGEGATQAEVAERLQTSRANVSRLLTEARRRGIVHIEVRAVEEHPATTDLAAQVSQALGLDRVFLSDPLPSGAAAKRADNVLGSVLAPAVGAALSAASLLPGEVLLVSSGRTMYEVAQCDLPNLPGVVVAPTLGGIDQPEGWYQTNEITRLVAAQIGGRATYLFAPALPGPDLYEVLRQDPAIERVTRLWPEAAAALVGIGAPPASRAQLPQFIAPAAPYLMDAVGDTCSRFWDLSGQPVTFPGSERLLAVELETLQAIPTVIAVAAGPEKVGAVMAGARAGYFNQLVTDPGTAEIILSKRHARQERLARRTPK